MTAMFCSTIIPTVGRDTLARAVQSVLDQTFAAADFEVIVVNDSGRPLSPAPWQQSPKVRIIHTQQRERSAARNTGAAIARGRYLHFLDDDDWLLPDAYVHFWELAQGETAVWLYGGFQFVDNQAAVLETTFPDENGNALVRSLAGEWIPLQASFMQRDAFFAAGGFDPLLTMFEDNDLARRVMLAGEICAMPHLAAAILRDEATTTTDYGLLQKSHHGSREKLLDQPRVWTRLLASARTRPVRPGYWYGRIASAYLSSTVWNVRRKRFFKVVSRLLYAKVSVFASGKQALTADFWRGATRSHQTRGFFTQNGMDDS